MLNNPSDKRLSDNGEFIEAENQFAQSHRVNVYGRSDYRVSLTLSQIDSLMNLSSQPVYISVPSVVCQSSDMQQLIDEQKTALTKQSEELAAQKTQVDELIQNLGKKITSKAQENLIIEILESSAARGVYPPSKAYADLKKGKISKDLADLFNQYSAILNLKSSFASENLAGLDNKISGIDVLCSLIKYPTYDDLPAAVKKQNEMGSQRKSFRVRVDRSELEFPMKTVYDSIPNPLAAENLEKFPENLHRINNLKISAAQRDFAWLDSDNFTVESENYPMQISYRRYASHPEYKVTDTNESKGVYNDKGELVAYVLDGPAGINPVGNNINAIYAHEYNANAYEIQSSDGHVRDYILELAEVKFHPGSRAQRLAATEIKRIDAASLAGPDNDYMVKAILARKEAERITRQDELDHIKYFDRNGKNWCEQIRTDWNKKLSENGPSWTEIISPTSYSITYFDRKGNPVIKETYDVHNTTPYRIEKVKTVRIF